MPDEHPNDAERLRKRRSRNLALFAVLGGFAALIYAITIVKISLGYGP
jgi:hypothetical protein